MNLITLCALAAAVLVLAMQDSSRDKLGRSIWQRIAAVDFDESDRTFLKLEALCLGVALVSFILLG